MEAKPTTPPLSRMAAFNRIGSELIAETLRAGREVRILVTGSSMLPALWPGDIIVARAMNDATPSTGELLLFMRDGWLCTHRMLRWLDDGQSTQLITRGDSAHSSDPPMNPAEIVGRAVAIIRDGRELPPPAREPSRAQKMASSAIRRSELLKRLVLKIHAMRRRSMMRMETECRA